MNFKIYILYLLVFLLVTIQAFTQSSKPVLQSAVDVSDMVQLQTGDLKYSLPVLAIPSVNESFPIYLTYTSSIGLNQEASWVGLGWVLDVGKISRQVSQIPDDYKGQRIFTKQYDPGDFDYVEIPNFFQRTANGIASRLGAAGKKFHGLSSMSISDQRMKEAVSIAQSSLNLPWAAGGSIGHNQNFAQSKPQKGGAYDPTGGMGGVNPIALFKAIKGPKINFPHLTSWDWTISEERKKRKFLWFNTNWDKSIRYTWYMDELKEERGYGILYQSEIPKTTVAPGSVSLFNPNFSTSSHDQTLSYFNSVITEPDNTDRSIDANFTSDYFQAPLKDKKEYENTSPIYWAPDYYRVAAYGLGGELQPVRFDNTSVATSFPGNKFYYPQIALHKHSLAPAQTGKVQFLMLEDQSNTYQYHKEALEGQYGLQYSGASLKGSSSALSASSIYFTEQSKGLRTQKPVDETFNGNNILYKAVVVHWYSVAEINNGSAKAAGFIDVHNVERLQTSPHSIGGFTVIDKRGYSYHFAIPVYGSEEQTIASSYPKENKPGETSTTTSKNYYETKYATSWLLTAITGPDFIDTGDQVGFVDNADKGHYVKFEYGKYQDSFEERSPKVGTAYSPEEDKIEMLSTTTRQDYYLNTISTPTHTALFVKKVRRDNRSSTAQNGVVTSLALEEILLLRKQDYQYVTDGLGLSYSGANLDQYLSGLTSNVLKAEDIQRISEVRDYISKNALQRIRFDYDYSLCQGAPNALEGKLSLKKLTTYGKGNESLTPPYEFSYHTNPSYHLHSWDAWGLYKNNQLPGIDKHKVENATDGTAWSLTQITTPLGATIHISYERDKYASVSGETLETGITEKWGGDLRVKEITLKEGEQVLDRYQYDYSVNALSSNSLSSGVATMEPAFCKGKERSLEDIYRYPSPLVTYSKVTRMYVQRDGNIADTRMVSTFYTADSQTVKISKKLEEQAILSQDVEGTLAGSLFPDKVKLGFDLWQAAYEIEYQDDKIGLVSSVEQVNKQGQTVRRTTYAYQTAEYGGFTQALHLMDNTYRAYASPPGDEGRADKRMSYRFINSISTRLPQRLASRVTTDLKTDVQQAETYLEQDRYTGEVTKVWQEDAYKNALIRETIPAYKQYPSMGSAFLGGKNLLDQTAASYTYKVDADKKPVGLLAAFTQTFSNQIPTLGLNQNQRSVWRVHQSYQWNGKKALNTDGSYPLADFTANSFNWTNPTEITGWEKTGEFTLTDTYQRTLEAKDINGNKVATRTDKSQKRIIATATNAAYAEMAFSGAEYYAGNTDEEGGVVRRQGEAVTAHAHTGKYSLLVGTHQEGFQYTLPVDKADLSRHFRASVWVYVPGETETQSELNQVHLQYSINGDVKASIHPVLQKSKSKSWYLLNLDIPAPSGVATSTGADVVISCSNGANRGVYFDDFRVHPLDAVLTAFVYDPFTGELTYTLDANNFYTRVEYDAMGRSIRTSKELLNFDFGDQKQSYRADKILQELKYNYSRGSK